MRENDLETAEHEVGREIEYSRQQLTVGGVSAPGVRGHVWRPSRTTISGLLAAFLLIIVVAFLAGYVPLQKREATLRAEAQAQSQAVPRVEVMRLRRVRAAADVRLPGTMQAITEAPILARADGYLKRRLVDIGDHVKTGQVIAEIDAPELDQQINQAEAAIEQAQAATEQAQANLAQATANRELARITAQRWKTLADRGIASQQDLDQYQAQLAALEANVVALEKAVSAQRGNVAVAQANLARLRDIQSYRFVKAPFDGVITVRNVDVGALVSSGNTLLYRIAQTGTLRTYVSVPQSSANLVHVGQPAVITVSSVPGRRFSGSVTRTANAIDSSSRTMLVEVAVPNADGTLLPGTYAEVDLSGSQSANPPLVAPAGAIVFRTAGAQVAVVQPDGTIHLQKVTVGRDYGDRVEILQGVEDGTTILTAPGDTAREGAKVVPVVHDPDETR